MQFIHLFLSFVLILSSFTSGKETRTGLEYFEEGKRLVNENRLDEASIKFWESIISHEPSFSYKVEDAFQNFLGCYKHQGKLATGYSFIAAQMYKMQDDETARVYLRKAYEVDPKNTNVLELLRLQGETETSLLEDKVENSLTSKQEEERPHHCRTRKSCEKHIDKPDLRKLEEGWEDERESDYSHTKSRLKSTPNINVTIPPMEKFEVAWDKFWKAVNDGTADLLPEILFKILYKHLTNETIYVDIGAFYGPTIFYSSQIAKRSFGLEPDPVSFSTLEHNLIFNPGRNIHVHGIAVAAPDDAGYIQFVTDKMGNGKSMIVPDLPDERIEHFEAAGFTLPFLFELWGIKFEENPVFIKISVESYECRLLPSFYEWLSHENIEHLTILVTFNPQIRACTAMEMQGVLKTFKLFSHVSCNDNENPLPITTKTSLAEFENILENQNCFTKGGKENVLLAGGP